MSSSNTSPSDIFNHPDRLIRIWENERTTRNLNVTLMWENIKYFSTVIGGLLVAQIGLLGFLWTIKNHGYFPYDVRELVIIFPVIIYFLAVCAEHDLKQRWSRFLLVASQLLKLEKLLGLHEEILPDNRFFKEDKYLFEDYRKNIAYPSSDEFIAKGMSGRNTYSSMRRIYLIFRIMSILLAILYLFIIWRSSNV